MRENPPADEVLDDELVPCERCGQDVPSSYSESCDVCGWSGLCIDCLNDHGCDIDEGYINA